MEHKYALCRVAVAPLRAAASDRSEITTQLLFGDVVEVLEQAEPWWHIRNAYDDYEGWMDFKQLTVIGAEDYEPAQDFSVMAPLQVDNTIIAADGTTAHLPAGSSLPFFSGGSTRLGTQEFKVNFEPHRPAEITEEKILEYARFFLNAPYQWGGKTLFGIDCSGFSQTVYKLLGLRIKRDASQQAEQGETVGFLPQAKLGDLAFFDNREGRIIHVGIMLSNNQIMHASGRVKIDTIDDQGIYSAELGRYSHQLRIIKRFF